MAGLIRLVLPALAVGIAALAGMLSADDSTKEGRVGQTAGAHGRPAGPDTIGPFRAASGSPYHPFFDHFVPAGAIAYGAANNDGVYVSTDGGESWSLRNEGLPRREVYPFARNAIETITSLGVDPLDPRRVAVTTSLGLYVSENAGRRWRAVPLGVPIKSVARITTVALSPWSRATYAVGTSFSGIFETTDGGVSWKSYADGLRFLYRGAGFYEEIAALAYSPLEPGVLFLGVDFGGGIYRSSRDKSRWLSLDFPAAGAAGPSAGAGGQILEGLAAGRAEGRALLVATTRSRYWRYELAAGGWTILGTAPPRPPISAERAARLARAAGHGGLYLTAPDASGESLARLVALAKRNGLDAFVVDVKDDFGRLTYDSRLPLARKMGAVRPFFSLRRLLAVAHENGIYVIGRMVVFKDEPLYRYDGYRYAIWDRKTNAPWGEQVEEVDAASGKTRLVQKEFFVDPYAKGAWEYNVGIARELEAMGIDEIQFDYFRFPSDGPLAEAEYRFARPGMTRTDALESFLVMVREAVDIPISVDLYGFNCWYRMGNWIGQDIERLAGYADVVCPMYYPSLFPPGFMEELPYLERAREIYREGTRRAASIVQGRAEIRPFVQAFLLLDNEVKMDRAGYSDYLRAQLAGAKAAHAAGFTLWNAASDYYMVTFPLEPYLPVQAAAAALLQ